MTDSALENGTSMLTLVKNSQHEMAQWSETKRKDFVETFEKRSRVTRYILVKTAEFLLEGARRRRFITDKHNRELAITRSSRSWRDLTDVENSYHNGSTVGGRSARELDTIAQERADVILKELPPLKKAVLIIQPETAKKIERRDKLLEQGQKLMDQLVELSENLELANMDQKMTIGDFREFIKEREKSRRALRHKLDEMGAEGTQLEDEISRALYSGIPGISEAVIKVINDHIEREQAFDATTRRVGERVMFGDSEAAMEILSRFEKDEVTVSEEIKSEFASALEKLKVAGQKKTAQLKSAKSK